MTKQKFLIATAISIPVLAVVVFLSVNAVRASAGNLGRGAGSFGFGQLGQFEENLTPSQFEATMIEQAGLLGISVAEMKNYWSQGKTLNEIAKDLGLSQADLMAKMKTAQADKLKQSLQDLVVSGSLTQAQADARLKFMAEQTANQAATGKNFKNRSNRMPNQPLNQPAN